MSIANLEAFAAEHLRTSHGSDCTTCALIEMVREARAGWYQNRDKADLADDLAASIDRAWALCNEARIGISRGCTCSGDEHVEGGCRYGEPLGWTLDPDAVRAALRGGS